MQSDDFDSASAKEFLLNRELKRKEKCEFERKKVLHEVITILKEQFAQSLTEVYLIGSILRPFSFLADSDIDIVVKNYQGDRFDFWVQLENKIKRNVEIIPFETCSFQEFILREGLKVI